MQESPQIAIRMLLQQRDCGNVYAIKQSTQIPRGVLPYKWLMGTYGPPGYGSQEIFALDRVSILSFFALNRVIFSV